MEYPIPNTEYGIPILDIGYGIPNIPNMEYSEYVMNGILDIYVLYIRIYRYILLNHITAVVRRGKDKRHYFRLGFSASSWLRLDSGFRSGFLSSSSLVLGPSLNCK